MVLRLFISLVVLSTLGCGGVRDQEDPAAWYDGGVDQDVVEPVVFTDQNYDFPANDADGIGAMISAVYPVPAWSTAFGPEDAWTGNTCETTVDEDLPVEIEGIVTLHPRWYFKSHGCDDGDEKFYGSFFIQDRTGGLFVLGDSKVAHFDMGARVRMKVRGVRTLYDLNVIYSHDILEIIDYGPQPIYYEEPSGDLALEHVGRVVSVTGEVVSGQDTFGEFVIQSDNGSRYTINIDADLSRRGFGFDKGTRITVRGPALYSYSTFGILVIRSGQVNVH
jgi:hypothetical protein